MTTIVQLLSDGPRRVLRTCMRGLRVQRLFSAINLLGLAIGLASVILIGLYVRDELSYDTWHPAAESLYRVSQNFHSVNGAVPLYLATNAAPAAELLKADFPEIEQVARLFGGRVLLARDDVAYYDDAIQFVDPAFLQIFHFEWLAGDPATALEQPFSIVLTESAARKYFGSLSPLGETLLLENALPLAVTGVVRDLPDNTHLTGNAFGHIEPVLRMFGEQARSSWTENNSYHTYVKLAPGASMAELQARFPDFLDRHVGEAAHEWTSLSALAVTDIHLHASGQGELKVPGSITTVLTLVTVAFGILVIACFNFVNLATALSALRSREVGVRKSLGAARLQLLGQFMGESLGMTVLASLLAIVLVEMLLPAFNGFAGKNLVFDLAGDSELQVALLVLVALVALAAGSWPALLLSAFKPSRVLRSPLGSAAGGLLFRNVLVVLQFTIAISLVIVTAVVLLQTRYARERDPGFSQEQVVILNGTPTQGVTTQWEALKAELLQHPDILAATASNFVPGQENPNSFSVRSAGAQQNLDFPLPFLFVGHDFFATYEVARISGRVFSREFAADTVAIPAPAVQGGDGARRDSPGNFVLNASAVADLGWTPETAVGQVLELERNGITLRGPVVGVVQDSHFESLRFSVKPLVFIQVPPGVWADQYPTLNAAAIRISPDKVPETLAYIDRTWQQFVPQFPITRSMLDERLHALYQNDARLGQLYGYSAALAILIACLGLFGLATFNAQRRIKEIGVRKVMGSSVWRIVVLLTNDFSKLVLIANVIAWPLAWVAMNRWLEQFAYRIDLTPMIFIGSGLIALCVAWVTVGGTAAKAASRKPVLALRYE